MNRTYTVNESAFTALNNDTSWVLGLLAADGHVQTEIGFWLINLHEQDKKVLENIKTIVGTNKKLYYRPAGKFINKKGEFNRAAQYALQVNSRVMVDRLMALGFTRHKSQELEWDDNRVPIHLLNHFVRGYFDGDGCIHFITPSDWRHRVPVVNFVGTHHFITGLQLAINNALDLERGCISSTDTYSCLAYTGPHSVMKLLAWMYQDSYDTNRMSRKYQKYVEYLNGDWGLYKKRAESPLSQITPEIATRIKQLFKEQHTLRAISELVNCSMEAVRGVCGGKSYVNCDGRSSRSTSYITAFGETKHLDEWVADPRCVVNEHTLYSRVFKKGLSAEQALTTLPDRASNSRNHFIEAFDETKTMLMWAKDPRCTVPYNTLRHRILKMNIPPEEALITPAGIKSDTNHAAEVPSNRASLTWAKVKEIRDLKMLGGLTNFEVAEKFGVSVYVINDVISGKSWKDETYVTPVFRGATQRLNYNGQSLTLTQISTICGVPKPTIDRRLREGMSLEDATKAGRKKPKPYKKSVVQN